MNYYAGIDLGGTKVFSIVINDRGDILSRAKLKLGDDKNIDAVLKLVNECYCEAVSKSGINITKIKAIGMAVPSAVDINKGELLNAPNLGWKNIKITEMMSNITGKKVFVDNDVNLGTYGEYCFGKSKDFKHIYGIFAGTGIGGGYICNGNLIRGASCTAGEIGHIIIKQGGPRCNCGNKGCLEAIAGKVGMIKYMTKMVEQKGNKTILSEIAPEWKKGVGSSAIRKAYAQNDEIVTKAVKRSAKAIGIAIANVINAVGVEAVILGGGVIEELGDIYLPIIKTTAAKYAMANGADSVTILQSELGDDAVALGAAWEAKKMK